MSHADASAAAESTESALERLVPLGWDRRFVAPPWKDSPKACRACGVNSRPGPWATFVVTRNVPDERLVLFTFAMICGRCAEDPTTAAGILSAKAFGSDA